MHRWKLYLGLCLAGLTVVGWLVVLGATTLGNLDFEAMSAVGRPPRIEPDYAGTVIPPNIAPLNFRVEEPGEEFRVRIYAPQGEPIEVTSRSGVIQIPPRKWRQLLELNRGGKLAFQVCVRGSDGQWVRFEPVENTIADADIDRYLCYRLIRPIYIVRVNVAIYQRDVETFEESVVVNNQSFGRGGGCVNCHAFAPGHPQQMILHSRGSGDLADLSGMIVVHEGRVKKIDTRKQIRQTAFRRGRLTKSLAGYVAWHPNGRVAAFASGEMMQFFHAVGENRDVFDGESDLAVYHVDSDTVTTAPQISRVDRVETFPAWSPDGQYLYFCSTDPVPRDRFREVRYDLMRIRYDVGLDQWGEIEAVLLAKDTGKSIVEPRVSPDGRWLLFCMCEYGEFPPFQPSSDLYLMDLETRSYRRLEINSPRSDSWHSWSSNSRWIVFASKRRDGIFARLYFSYIEEQGRAHKPVLLPQKDPTFYDRFLKTYNVPELSPWPVPVSEGALVKAICGPAVPSDG